MRDCGTQGTTQQMKNNEQRETEDLNAQDKRTGEAKLNTLYTGQETVKTKQEAQ